MIKIWSDLLAFESSEHVIIWNGADNLALNSGTHKSHLFTLMEAQWNDKLLHATKNLVFMNHIQYAKNLVFNAEDCLILDEANYSPADLNNIFQKIRAANAYMIVIGRLLIKQLEYSVGAIYEFEYCKSNVLFRQVFTPVNTNSNRNDLIACEDSTQVASVYSTILRRDVKAVYGRSNFYTDVRRNAYPLLIADYPKFGVELLRLLHRLYASESRSKALVISLFCPNCFEQIVCEVAEQYGVKLPVLNADDYFDAEYFYEDMSKAIPKWDKAKVTESVIDITRKWDMGKSQTLQELYRFVIGDLCNAKTLCYEVNIKCFAQSHLALNNVVESGHIERSSVF